MAKVNIFLIALLIAAAGLAAKAFAPTNWHKCKWECPYEGIKPGQWAEAVKYKTGEQFTDTYCIDILHLERPDLDFDQLETELWK